MPQQSIGDALRVAIRRDPRNQNELAAESGVDASVLSRFMSGQRSPTLDTANRVCRVLRLRLVLDQGGSPNRRKKAGR